MCTLVHSLNAMPISPSRFRDHAARLLRASWLHPLNDTDALNDLLALANPRWSLTEIRADSRAELLRLAWHIGNRHLPAQLAGDRIYIREDYVITEMLRGLGASLRSVLAPFSPEQGAYAGGHGHHDAAAAHPYVFSSSASHGH